jgi:hypothetical protein
MVSAQTQSYVQPISVPKPLIIYIQPSDPRNNTAYLQANPNVQVLTQGFSTQAYISVSPPDASIQNKIAAAKTNSISYNANSITAAPTSTSTNNLMTTNLNTSATPTTDQLTPAINSDTAALINSSSPVFLASETNDPLGNILFSDIPVVAQPPDATPPPTYALDAPENIYIDPTAFALIKSPADGTISYTASLQFDDVDAANSYEVRINVSV